MTTKTTEQVSVALSKLSEAAEIFKTEADEAWKARDFKTAKRLISDHDYTVQIVARLSKKSTVEAGK